VAEGQRESGFRQQGADRRRRWAPPWAPGALAGLAPLGLFLLMAGSGLRSDFFPDDMMNIYSAWRESWRSHLESNLLFFAGHHRPLGSLLYRALFEIAGLRPLPFRLVCFGLLMANLWVTYRTIRALSGSGPAAFLGALLAAYHAYLSDLYYSSATIYDLLCYLFFYAALAYYVVGRKRGRPGIRQLAAVGSLCVLALNSKEMAASLWVLLAGYEVVFVGRQERDFRAAGLCGGLAVCSLLPKLAGEGPLSGNAAYEPSAGWALANLGHYLGMLFYRHRAFSGLGAGLVLAGTWLAACLLRRRPAVAFAALIVTVTPLPVLVIAPRSLYVFYVPMLGWWLLGAVLLWEAFGVGGVRASARPFVAAAVCAGVLLPLHWYRRPFGDAWVEGEGRKVREVLAELDRRLPDLPAGSRVLFVDDPFAEDDFILTFLLRLRYADPTIRVDRAKQGVGTDRAAWADYDYVAAIRDWRLALLKTPPDRPQAAPAQ